MSRNGWNRMIEEVPQQKAADQASLAGITTSKKNRWSSGQTRVANRLVWIGSGLMKCWGVWTMPTWRSRKSVIARDRKFGIGTKSASRIEMNCGGFGSSATFASAWLMLPALAWELSGR